MDPAKYIMDSRVKTKACTTLVKTARNIMGSGARNMPARNKQDGQHQIFTHDIAEETQSQGEHPGEVADDLNDEEQRRQGRDGSQKVLDIFRPVVLDPQVMGIDKGAQGQGQGDIDIGRGRDRNPGTSPMRLQNMMNRKKVAMNGKKARPSSPVTSTMNSSRPPTISLKDILGARGHQVHLAAGQPAQPQQDEADQHGIAEMRRNM